MLYKSPISLISTFLQQSDDLKKLNLTEIKKRILAEFELYDKSTIQTKSGEYSKNEILAIFENLRLTEDIEYHLIISKFPALLSFLENSMPSDKLSFSDPCFKDENFIRFLSPYLAESLGNFYASCIRNPQYPIGFAVRVNFPVLPEHEHRIVQPVYHLIDGMISEIEAISSIFSTTGKYQDASKYFKSDLIRIFNLLPRQYFANAIDMYAQCGINLIITFLRKKDISWPYSDNISLIYKQLDRLLVSNNIKSKLSSMKGAFAGTETVTTSTSSDGSGRAIFFVLFIVITIFRISNQGCNESRNNSFENTRRNFEIYNKNYSIKIDSLSHEYDKDENLKKLLKSINERDSLNKMDNKRQAHQMDSISKVLDSRIGDSNSNNNENTVRPIEIHASNRKNK